MSKIADAMQYIDDGLIAGAVTYKRKKNEWVKWAVLAACLCLVAAGIWQFGRQRAADSPATAANIPGAEASTADAGTEETEITADTGVYIPAIELPENTEGVAYDMLAMVVYKGGIYTQAECFYGEDALKIDALTGEHLGCATGSINEWSTQEEYTTEFASSVSGEVYTVSGYDEDFRICVRNEYKDENGDTQLWIQFLDRLNGISLKTGADLFESRLKLRGRITGIQCQSHEDWNQGFENIRDAELDETLWENFLDRLDAGAVIYTWSEKLKDATIYDTDRQAHIFLNMEDGTVVPLRLIEGGYVGYDYLGWYFVQMPGDVFDAVFAACGEK